MLFLSAFSELHGIWKQFCICNVPYFQIKQVIHYEVKIFFIITWTDESLTLRPGVCFKKLINTLIKPGF